MTIGIQCLLADDVAGATRLATRLDGINRERRQIEAKMQADALAALRTWMIRSVALRSAMACACSTKPGTRACRAGGKPIKDRTSRPVIALRAPVTACCAARRARCPVCTSATCWMPSRCAVRH